VTRHLLAASLLLFSLPAWAEGEQPAPPSSFPTYAAIEGNVRFWVQVYGEWGLGQVVVHDARRPELIYEVVALPGVVGERYTPEQRAFIDGRADAWRAQLRALEQALAEGQPLDDEQKSLAVLVTTTAGSASVQGAADRVRLQRGVRDRFRRGLEISKRYDALIRETLRQEGVPEDLAFLPHVESSFQSHAVSSAGAVGAWQFTRSAGRRYLQVTSAFDERLDAVLAARGAARYLKDAYATLGQWPLALTSYNHGVGGMVRAVAAHGPDYERIFLDYEGRVFGFASRNFYSEFLAAIEVASHAETYFPEGLSPETPLDHERWILPRASSPRAIARRHGLGLEELSAINPAWTARAVRSDLSIPAHATVWLPLGTLAANRPPPPDARADGRSVTEYVVQPGDTLDGIARRYAVTVADLRRWSGFPEGSTIIQTGQRLVVSGQRAPVAPDGEHVVRSGETLSTIAGANGLSIDELRALNRMSPRDSLIRPGQRLQVSGEAPGPARSDETVHVVRPGETLVRIATRYGVRLADLLHLNQIDAHTIIHPGQRIVIPFLSR